MCCAWKINRELAEMTEALGGILHSPVLTASALRRHWLPLPILGSCPCLLLLSSLPLWGTNQSPCSPESHCSLPAPFSPLGKGNWARPSSQGHSQGSATSAAHPLPSCSFCLAEGQQLQEKGQGTCGGGQGALRRLLAVH